MTLATRGRSSQKPSPAELVSRAGEIAADVRTRANETEANRRVADDIVARIEDAGLWRIMQPAARGGYEYGIDVLAEVGAVFGRACGSTAWVYSVVNTHQWFVAGMAKGGAGRVLGRSERARGRLLCARRQGGAGGRRLADQRHVGLRQRLRQRILVRARGYGADSRRRRRGEADVPAGAAQ